MRQQQLLVDVISMRLRGEVFYIYTIDLIFRRSWKTVLVGLNCDVQAETGNNIADTGHGGGACMLVVDDVISCGDSCSYDSDVIPPVKCFRFLG